MVYRHYGGHGGEFKASDNIKGGALYGGVPFMVGIG